MESRQVSFMLEEAEFRRLFLANGVRRPGMIVMLFFILVVFALLLWLGILSKSISIFVFLIVYCIVLGTLGGLVIPKSRYHSEIKRGRIERRTVTISSSGVELTTKDTDVNIGWEKIKKVKQNGGWLWIIVSRQAKIAIPRRAFSTPTESREFYQDMVQFMPQK